MKCEQCGKRFELRRKDAKFCSAKCRTQYHRDNYDASNIKILDTDELLKLRWKYEEYLADKYKKPIEWIKRSLDACDRAATPHEYFVLRYLEKENIPINRKINDEAKIVQYEAFTAP